MEQKETLLEIMFTGHSSLSMPGGIHIRHIVLFIVIILLVSTPAASALSNSLSFSAVDEHRAHRQSGFFEPNDVKEESQKKLNLINQRNALAKNLNEFNRDQNAILKESSKQARDISQAINEFNKQQDQNARDLAGSADEIENITEMGFHYVKDRPDNVTLPNGRVLSFQQMTYYYGGQVMAVLGEVIGGRDGSVSVKNTYSMGYKSILYEAQGNSYESTEINLITGRIAGITWYDGIYWTEEDVNNDDQADSEMTSGHRVKEKLASYTEESTSYYPSEDRDPWTGDVKSWMKLNLSKLENITSKSELESYVGIDLDNFEEGVTSKTERTEMRYYTEGDEQSNTTHIKDQLASYHDVQSSVDGRYSDVPAVVSEVDWYDAEYDWAFKHEDDRNLVFRPNESEEYIDDFKRTETEKEQKRSVSLITKYTEHSEDNIGHNVSRSWDTYITDYDKFGRVLEYNELLESVEGTDESHRFDIDYWDFELFTSLNDSDYGEWDFPERPDVNNSIYQRSNFGKVRSFNESSNFRGGYSSSSLASRIVTCYDSYGRLLAYEEHSEVDGVGTGIHFDVWSYRDEGWVSNVIGEYFEIKGDDDGLTEINFQLNSDWNNDLLLTNYTVFTIDSNVSELDLSELRGILSNVRSNSSIGTLTSAFNSSFNEWGSASITNRHNIGYNSRNQMTDYVEDSWQFGWVEVEIPILENGEVVVDPETGAILTEKSEQDLDVRSRVEWWGARYDGRGRMTEYNQRRTTSAMAGITTYTMFRNGIYDRFGRQIGFNEATYITGNYREFGELKEINAVSIRERHSEYTVYNDVGQIYSYRDRNTDPNGAVTESWVLDTQYNDNGQLIAYNQESVPSEGSRTRSEVTDQVYNKLGQTISYKEDNYEFTDDGNLRSRSTTERINTSYDSLGRVVETVEVTNKGGVDVNTDDTGYYIYRNFSYPRSLFQFIDTNPLNEQESNYQSDDVSSESSVYMVLQTDANGNIVRYERLDYDENGSWVSGSIVDKVVRTGNGTRNDTVQFEIARDYNIDTETGQREFELGGGIPSHLQEAVDAYLGSLPIYSKENEKIINTWWTEGFATGDPDRLGFGYNSIGRMISYHDETNGDTGHSETDRTGITYNSYGMMESFNESGIDEKGDEYSFVRSNITYRKVDSQVSGYDEIGYNAGNGDISYSLIRKDMDYIGGQLVSYNENGIGIEGEEYELTRSNIKYFGDMMIGYKEFRTREDDIYEFTRSDIVYDGEDRIVGYHESGTDTSGIKYDFNRTILGYIGKNPSSYEEAGSWSISDNIPVGKSYWFRVDDQLFGNESGRLTITTEVNDDGSPVKSITSYYIIRNGSRIFTDGELSFNEYDDLGRVVSNSKYELFYDPIDENGSPSDLENYDVTVRKVEVTNNLEYDVQDNARYIRTENYILEEGQDGFQNVEMEDVFSTDLSNVETHLTDGEWQREYTGDTFSEMLAYDIDGNVLTSEEYNFFADDSSGNYSRIYYEGSLVNNEYDGGRLIESNSLTFHIDEKDDSTPVSINDSFDIIRNLTERKYTGITMAQYEDHDGTNPGTITTENYKINRSVLESDDPGSMILLYDNNTGSDTRINTGRVGEGDPNSTYILEYEYFETTYNDDFDIRGNPGTQNVYHYVLDDNDTKLYTDGEVIENSYDEHGRTNESKIVNFVMEFDEDQGSGQNDLSAYSTTYKSLVITRTRDFDTSGKYQSEVEVDNYELGDEVDDQDDVLTEDGRINESAFRHISGSEIGKSNFDHQGTPTKTVTFNYFIDDDDNKLYVDGTLEVKIIDEHKRIEESGTYELVFDLVMEPDSEGNPQKPEPVNGAYLFEDYNVTVVKYQLRQVTKDDNGEYLFDVYDIPIKVGSKEYDISDENSYIPGIRTFLDLRNLSIKTLELKMIFIVKDTDGDGIIDLDDECPYQDATGFDADSDGCIDSISGLQTLIGEASDGDVSPKIAKSLMSKANNANADLEKGKKRSAVNKLKALVNEIEAQSGKKISKEHSELLIEYTKNILMNIRET